MKKLFPLLLLLFITKAHSQQKLNWGEVLYGDINGLKANKIKTLYLKKDHKVLRSVEVVSERTISVKDSLYREFYNFDTQNRLISVKSAKKNGQQNFTLHYKDHYVNGLSRFVQNNETETYNKRSRVSFNNLSYEENESYSFDRNRNDSLHVFRTQYFFNRQNPDLSYEETYDNGKIWTKRYFNRTEVRKKKFSDYFTVDSTLQKEDNKLSYHFENYPDRQIIKIEKDSVLTITKKDGRKIGEKLEYAGMPFKETFYDERGNVKEAIIYINYRNPNHELITWEMKKYNGTGKLISSELPNKKIYKLKNGVLQYRKKTEIIKISCGGGYSVKNKNFISYYLQNYSPSILFSLKFARGFVDNFDITAIEEDEDMIYTHLNFTDDATVTAEYSASKDIKSEFRRTSRSVRKTERLIKYFKDMQVEAVTEAGKKYTLDLAQNPELLSFSIHTFFIKD